jgi:hypothetical protein
MDMDRHTLEPDHSRGCRQNGRRSNGDTTTQSAQGATPEAPVGHLDDLRFDKALAHRVANKHRAVVEIQFLHDMCPVRLDGLHADIELAGDFRVGGTLGDQREDGPLAIRKAVV